MSNEELYLFWGKAADNRYHPAICHMLDAGMVAREIFRAQPDVFRHKLAAELGASPDSLPDVIGLIAALHDIGKISPGFQAKRVDFCAPLVERGYEFSKADQPLHGYVALDTLPELFQEGLGCCEEVSTAFSRVLAAHHGVFVNRPSLRSGSGKWSEARKTAVRFLADCFEVAGLENIAVPSTPSLLVLAGLITVSDWLSSSEDYFTYGGGPPSDLAVYLLECGKRSAKVVGELRLQSVRQASWEFSEIFGFGPNPCQLSTMDIAGRLRPPFFIVVESPMGSGKTEAAQAVYAQRNGHFRGMYYALPTQATGNAMLPRMEQFLSNFCSEAGAELHLLHANADLNCDYERLRLSALEGDLQDVSASSWFTAKKRGLLAGYGVGTIDQSLLAVLAVKHFFVRLFGLAGKLVVFDEVHAYDAYVGEELRRLIGWLASCGTSVVLLSATLPQARRKRLLAAFRPGVMIPQNVHYPCVFGVDEEGTSLGHQINGLDKDTIYLAPVVASPEEKTDRIVSLLSERLADNEGCVACIMNTVRDAQDLYERAKKAFPDTDLALFHSRFTLERRLAIESYVLSRYKKDGTRPRKGIVIATQVLEQSLDVDFDFMVTDLAPIDLLLQRAGRLHRHMRDRPRSMRRRALHVIMPEFLSSVPRFGGSAGIYEPDILLRTCLLFARPDGLREIEVEVPYGMSGIIESVYDEEIRTAIPRHLIDMAEKWESERLGNQGADEFFASANALMDAQQCRDDPDYLGLLANNRDEEQIVFTRLTRPGVTLIVLNENQPLAVKSRDEERLFYSRSIKSDHPLVVRTFTENNDPPAQWRDAPLLRHCRPLFLSGTSAVDLPGLLYDDELGLRFESK